jgi:hypothetical protein
MICTICSAKPVLTEDLYIVQKEESSVEPILSVHPVLEYSRSPPPLRVKTCFQPGNGPYGCAVYARLTDVPYLSPPCPGG